MCYLLHEGGGRQIKWCSLPPPNQFPGGNPKNESELHKKEAIFKKSNNTSIGPSLILTKLKKTIKSHFISFVFVCFTMCNQIVINQNWVLSLHPLGPGWTSKFKEGFTINTSFYYYVYKYIKYIKLCIDRYFASVYCYCNMYSTIPQLQIGVFVNDYIYKYNPTTLNMKYMTVTHECSSFPLTATMFRLPWQPHGEVCWKINVCLQFFLF